MVFFLLEPTRVSFKKFMAHQVISLASALTAKNLRTSSLPTVKWDLKSHQTELSSGVSPQELAWLIGSRYKDLDTH